MTGARIAPVTGATAGLGRAAAVALAGHGMHVLVHGRNAKRTAAVVDQVSKSGGSAQAVLADLASLGQVHELAERIAADHDAIALLINNAGIGAGRPPYRKRQLSTDGHELRLAVNYLAPVLLARRLIPALKNGASARIINVGSVGQAPVDVADLRMDGHYTTAVMNLATGPVGGTVTGRYFDGRTEARAHQATYDPAVRSGLRTVTAELLAPFLTSRAGTGSASVARPQIALATVDGPSTQGK